MIFSDITLKEFVDSGVLSINPTPAKKQFQPASIDLRLDKGYYRIYEHGEEWYNETELVVSPGDFIIASTMENIRLPDDMVARVEGRSSYGRKGLIVHVTAGFIDPGFHGKITLEITNVSPRPIVLHKGDCVCQMVVEELDQPCLHPYIGYYQNQDQATLSKFERNSTTWEGNHGKK